MNLTDRIYLDHNATTPLDPAVRAAMEPYLGPAGNPSSIHAEGRRARAAVDDARDRIAALLGVKPGELVFTGGGTESNNLAIRGLARAGIAKGRHLVTAASEHHAVLETCEALQREGWEVTFLPVDAWGRTDPDALEAALRPDTVLATVMTANNETGVRQPVAEFAERCARRGVLFHTDAVQSAGKDKLPIGRDGSAGITALSLTAHKFYGPLGAGLLFLRAGQPLDRLTHGGSQENTRRPGTENVAAIVGLAEALARAEAGRAAEGPRQFALVERLWSALADLPGARRNGDPNGRIANTLSVSFAGLDGEDLLIALDLAGLALSSGSACLVGSVLPSHVLRAMGVPPEAARATVRLSFGKATTAAEIDEAARRTREVVLRQVALLAD